MNRFSLFLCLFEIAIYLSNDMYLPALPQIMHELNISSSLVQFTLISWLLGTTSTQLLLGPISDRYGRKPLVLIAAVTFIISSIVCAFSYNITILLLGRFIQGCTVCAISVAGYAAIHELYDTRQAIQIISLMASITVLAPAFGPLLGSLVLLQGSWRLIFLILAVWGLISFYSLLFSMPETHQPEKRTCFNLSTLLKNYAGILKNKVFMEHTLIHSLISIGIVAWITISPLLVIDSFKYSPLAYGLIQAGIFLGFMAGARLVQKNIMVINTAKLIRYGLIIVSGSSLTSLVLAVLWPHFLLGFILSMGAYATGGSIMFGTLNRLAIDASDKPMGVRLSIFSSIISLAVVGGGTLASLSYDGTILSIACVLSTVSVLACFVKLYGPTNNFYKKI
ncbi:MFS transporter [soil metagenome]